MAAKSTARKTTTRPEADSRPAFDAPKWRDLLAQAVNEPGLIHSCYSQFHNFSIGNQMLALMQCMQRGIAPGPMTTYDGWLAKGRHVKRGETGIYLWRPVTVKPKDAKDDDDRATIFVLRKFWFVYAQTEGDDLPPAPVPGWDRDRALAALGVELVEYESMNGNSQGYATRRQVALSPMAVAPFKTLVHEMAHVLLGHTGQATMTDAETLTYSIAEAEAESVALLICDALGLTDGAAYSRGYIQHWLKGDQLTEANVRRIFRVADQILKAGSDAETETE